MKTHSFRIRPPRLLKLIGGGLCVLLAAWVLLAGGAWWFVKNHRDFPGVNYLDLAWPGRWAQYRISQGNHYIAQAPALLQQGDYPLALHKLRVGIAKSPANADGRILLARVYIASRRPDLAKEVLLQGLNHLSLSPAYLQATFSFLIEQQEDATLTEITQRMLADPATPAPLRPLLATYAATIALARGHHDEAETLLDTHALRDTPDGDLLLARITWERGWPDLACLGLQAHLRRYPRHDTARALLAEYYLRRGLIAEWESSLVERIAADPLAPAPRIAYLQLHHRRDDSARLEHEAAVFLRQFAADPSALLLLGDFAARTGRPTLARQVEQALARSPEHAAPAALLLAEAHLVAREYQATLSLLTRLTQESSAPGGRLAPAINSLQAVALCGLGRNDEARLALEHLLSRQNLRADNLVAVSDRLQALGATELARTTLTRAVEADPLNQSALTQLIRLELDTGTAATLPAHLSRFLRLRQPSRELLARARATLGSDRHLLLPEQRDLLAALQTALAPVRP